LKQAYAFLHLSFVNMLLLYTITYAASIRRRQLIQVLWPFYYCMNFLYKTMLYSFSTEITSSVMGKLKVTIQARKLILPNNLFLVMQLTSYI